MPRTFIHSEVHPTDPAFLHDERQFLERQWGVLHVMEREREHLTVTSSTRGRWPRGPGSRSTARKRAVEKEEKRLLSLIGIGNHFRRDDAAGLEVVRRLRLAHPPGVILIEQEGEPASLIEAWSTVEESLVVDAISSGSEPGRLHRFDVTDAPLPAEIFSVSTHALGLPEAVELARELGRLPRLVVYGIEGETFEAGEGLSDPVEKTVEKLVLDLYNELTGAS